MAMYARQSSGLMQRNFGLCYGLRRFGLSAVWAVSDVLPKAKDLTSSLVFHRSNQPFDRDISSHIWLYTSIACGGGCKWILTAGYWEDTILLLSYGSSLTT